MHIWIPPSKNTFQDIIVINWRRKTKITFFNSKSESDDSESESDDSESKSDDSESESHNSESESDDSESKSDDPESESHDSESESDFNSVFMNLDTCIFLVLYLHFSK